MRNTYVANYRKARADLLLMAVLTTINMVLLLVNADYAFAFSATFPQIALAFGVGLAEEFGSAALVIGAVMGFASIGLYYLCWALSKQHPGAIIAALVLFSLDTVILLVILGLTAWVDIVFHVAVLVYLIIGTVAVVKLRHLPPEEAVPGAAMPAAAVTQPYTTVQPAPMPAAQQPYAAQPAPVPAAQQPYAAQPAPVPTAQQPSYVTQPIPVAGAQPVYTAPEAPAAVPPVPAAGAAPAVPDDGRLPADFPSASQR